MRFDASRVAASRADRIAIWVLLWVISLGILAATLTPAAEWRPAKGRVWCVLCDAGSAVDASGNTLLFFPFGFVLALAGVRGVRTVPFAAAFSVGVELLQFVIPGRDPNVGDVLFNSSGAMLGWMVAQTQPGRALGRQIVRVVRLGVVPPVALRAWLTLGSAAGVTGLIVVTCVLLTRDYPDGPYFADGGSLDSTNGPLHLGGNPRDSDFYLGVIDEVKVFSRARSAEEITTDMTAPLTLAGADHAASEGLVAAYDFDRDSGATVVDVSGHGHDGVASQAVHAEGRFGKGLQFSGRAEDVVSIPSARDLNLANDLTIEAWVFPIRQQPYWGNVLHKDGDAYFLSAGSSGSLRAAAGGSFAGQIETLYASALLPLNAWSHLAMTYDGATLVFYVNGERTAAVQRWSSGRLLEASVGSSRIDANASESELDLRSELLKGGPIRLDFEEGRASGALAPVVRIRDRRNREVLVVATELGDLVLRSRVLAARFGLMSPTLRIRSILEPHPSREVRVNIHLDANRYRVASDGRSWRGVGPSVASGWAFFVDSAIAPWWLERLCSAAWIAVLFIVPGFCAYRFGATLAAAGLMGVSLVAVPGWLGVTSVPSPLLITAVSAFVSGWGLRVLIHRKMEYA